MKIRHLLGFLIVTVLAPVSLVAQSKCFDINSYNLSPGGKIAYESLEKETMFALGGIGYGGETSEGEEAMRILLQEPSGRIAFFKLSTTDSGAGGLYGMIGLKILKSECFKEASETFDKLPDKGETKGWHKTLEPGEVGFMSGCLYFVVKRKDLAKQIGGGKFDIWAKSIESQIIGRQQQ